MQKEWKEQNGMLQKENEGRGERNRDVEFKSLLRAYFTLSMPPKSAVMSHVRKWTHFTKWRDEETRLRKMRTRQQKRQEYCYIPA